MKLFLIICIFFIYFNIASIATSSADSNSIVQPQDISKLSAAVKKRGHIRIIVGLKLPPPGFRPEGTLNPAEQEQQRKAITAGREALLDSLSCYDFKVYRTYTSIPYIAMKVNADALDELVSSPYVLSIEKDSPDILRDNNTPENVEENADIKAGPKAGD
jgi:hypothetical protein